MTKKLLTILCMAVMLTACSNADSSTAEVTTPAGQTTTTTTTTTESEPVEDLTTTTTTSEEQSVTTTTTTTTTLTEPTVTTTTPEEITTTTTAETTKPKVTTTTKKPTTTTKAKTTTTVKKTTTTTTTTTKPKTTTTTTTTTKKAEDPPKDGTVMYSAQTAMYIEPNNNTKRICAITKGEKLLVVGNSFTKNGAEWYRAYYDNQYGYVYANRVTKTHISEWTTETCDLINALRKQNGLSELIIDDGFKTAAQLRADENASIDALTHTRPDGSKCFTVFDELGLDVTPVGEVAAWTSEYYYPAAVTDGWMNSEGHRAIIMSDTVNYIGCGYSNGHCIVIVGNK